VRKHPLAQMIALGVFAAVVGTAIVLLMDWFPTEADTAAPTIDTLYDVLLVFSVPIFVLVMSVVIYSVVRFRARPGDMGDGAPIHGNTRLEVFWVTVPFLIVTGLSVYGWIVLNDIEKKKPNTMIVNVTAQQFTWHFDYPSQKVKSDQLILPKDRPVEFRLHTKDVIHSFWVPEFRLKSDIVPGMTTKIRLTPNRVGEWNVVCAELCGLGHSTMRQEVKVMPAADFQAWVRKNGSGGQLAAGGGQGGAAGGGQGGAAGGGQGGAAAGKAAFASNGCAGCHTFKPSNASGTVGPDLDQLKAVAAKREKGKSAEAYVKESIDDPRAFTVKGFPKNVMPATSKKDIPPEQLDALVQYLLSGGK
jgi:cytochrome c oxidase subunit 2